MLIEYLQGPATMLICRVATLTLLAACAHQAVLAQATSGFSNSAVGGFTPQPNTPPPALGTTANQLQSDLERGFNDVTSAANQQLAQADSATRNTVDQFGRVITQPINNARQFVGDVADGPQNPSQLQPGRPIRNVAELTGDGIRNVGEALGGVANRAEQNLRNLTGGNPPPAQIDPLRQPAAAFADPSATVAQPSSWGTAADPLASPPAGASLAPVQPQRSVLVDAGAPNRGQQQPWSNQNNVTPAMTGDPQFDAPALRPNPNMQPVGMQPQPTQQQQPLFSPLANRNPPQMVNPATGTQQNWNDRTVDGRPLAPVQPVANNVQPSAGQSDPWANQQPVHQTAMPPLSVPENTAPGTNMVSNQQPGGSTPNQEAIERWRRENTGGSSNMPNPQVENQTPETAGSGFAPWFLAALLVGSAVGNFYQWFNILDLRNKYRTALRRGSPSLARSMV